MYNQELVRKKLKDLHYNNGVSYAFMSRQSGVGDSLLRKFVSGERELKPECIEKIIFSLKINLQE